VVCLSVILKPRQLGRPGLLRLSSYERNHTSIQRLVTHMVKGKHRFRATGLDCTRPTGVGEVAYMQRRSQKATTSTRRRRHK
jgi:hypothetical protein